MGSVGGVLMCCAACAAELEGDSAVPVRLLLTCAAIDVPAYNSWFHHAQTCGLLHHSAEESHVILQMHVGLPALLGM
jgi:hypothetical protein